MIRDTRAGVQGTSMLSIKIIRQLITLHVNRPSKTRQNNGTGLSITINVHMTDHVNINLSPITYSLNHKYPASRNRLVKGKNAHTANAHMTFGTRRIFRHIHTNLLVSIRTSRVRARCQRTRLRNHLFSILLHHSHQRVRQRLMMTLVVTRTPITTNVDDIIHQAHPYTNLMTLTHVTTKSVNSQHPTQSLLRQRTTTGIRHHHQRHGLITIRTPITQSLNPTRIHKHHNINIPRSRTHTIRHADNTNHIVTRPRHPRPIQKRKHSYRHQLLSRSSVTRDPANAEYRKIINHLNHRVTNIANNGGNSRRVIDHIKTDRVGRNSLQAPKEHRMSTGLVTHHILSISSRQSHTTNTGHRNLQRIRTTHSPAPAKTIIITSHRTTNILMDMDRLHHDSPTRQGYRRSHRRPRHVPHTYKSPYRIEARSTPPPITGTEHTNRTKKAQP